MRRTLRFLAAAMVLAVATPAPAGNGTRAIGFGPVQDSLGGASVGAPLEATAMMTNPAGLAGMKRGADFIISYFNQMVSYGVVGPAGDASYPERGRPWFPMPTLGLVVPVGAGVTLGLGTACGGPFGVSQMFYPGSTRTSGWNRRIAVAGAYEISSRLAVGVTANAMWNGLNTEAPGGTSLPRDKATAWGYGAILGVTYRPVDTITLGAAYESRGSFQDYAWNVPAHQVFDPETGTMVAVPGGTERLHFDLPQIATVGASVRPIERLLVAVDLEWIDWSSTHGKGQPVLNTDQRLTGAHRWSMGWKDQVVVKVGAQYEICPSVKIRAGYDYGRRPVDPSRAFENVDFPAIAEHHFTAGAGVTFGDVAVNLAGVYAPRVSLSGANASQGISSYEVELSELTLDLGVAYRF